MADDKTYILELKNGQQRRVTVPANWKVTFGPLIPGERGGGNGCLALRFYETKDKQRAIFTDVKSFRDSEIPILEKRVKTKRQVVEKASKQGQKGVVVEAKIEDWVNPDEPEETPEEFLSLDHVSSEDDGEISF